MPPTHMTWKLNPLRQSGLKRAAHVIPAAAHIPLGRSIAVAVAAFTRTRAHAGAVLIAAPAPSSSPPPPLLAPPGGTSTPPAADLAPRTEPRGKTSPLPLLRRLDFGAMPRLGAADNHRRPFRPATRSVALKNPVKGRP
jgi:hypothetical protein